MMVDRIYLVDSDVFITGKTCITHLTSALVSGRAWFIITGRVESSVSTGFAASYSPVTRRRISSDG